MKQMYKFHSQGYKVFIPDDVEREEAMMTRKYATMFDDGKAMSLRSQNCNIYYLPIPLRPANNGMAFPKNSVFRDVFSDA